MKSKLFYFFVALLVVSTAALAGTNKTRAKGPMNFGYGPAAVAQSAVHSHGEGVTTYGPGDSLGMARYDYGSNGGPEHNIVNFGDGTLAVGRMASVVPGWQTSGYPDRGTYYAYYDGSKWSAFKKVETARRGWGNIDQFSDGGGVEIILSHVGPEVILDASKGAGSWTSSGVVAGALGVDWPRLATGKGSNVYEIGSPGTPDTHTPYFMRSTDGGSTWDTAAAHQKIFATASTGDADAYDIAVYKGGSVDKVGVGHWAAGNNVYVTESTDAGATWTETLVYAVKADSGTLKHNQTQLQPDGCGSLIYDNTGNLHVVWSNFTAIGDSLDRTVLNYALSNAILHWDKASGKISTVALPKNDSTIINKASAYMPGVDGALICGPDIGVDASNHLYVTYFGASSDIPSDSLAYNHVYATYSTNGGSTWKVATDLTPVTGSDNTYPSLADLVDSNLHLVYLTSPLQGNSVQGNHADTTVIVKHLKVAVSSLLSQDLVEVRGGQVGAPMSYSLDQNYPNPFNPTTNISFTLPATSTISLKVYNVLGQEVATVASGTYNAGVHTLTFDASRLSTGVYFYKLEAGSFETVKKMMLLK